MFCAASRVPSTSGISRPAFDKLTGLILICGILAFQSIDVAAQTPTANADGPSPLNYFDRLQQIEVVEVPPTEAACLLNLRGKITDKSGRSLADAVVVLTDNRWLDFEEQLDKSAAASNVFARTSTNANGEYEISGARLPSGLLATRMSGDSMLFLGYLIVADRSGRMTFAQLKAAAPAA